jgi:hypothetical protein
VYYVPQTVVAADAEPTFSAFFSANMTWAKIISQEKIQNEKRLAVIDPFSEGYVRSFR